MEKTDWTKLVTRRLAPQVAIAWNHGFGEHLKKRYGTAIMNTLVNYDGKKTDYFVDGTELAQFNRALDALLDERQFVLEMIPEAKEFIEETYEHIKEMLGDADSLGNGELRDLYNDFSHHHGNFYSRMWMVFRICERLVQKVKSLLAEKVGDERARELARAFSVPLEPNDVTQERMDLLRLAIDGKETRLPEHVERYRHIPMFDFDHEPYTEEYFLEQLYAIENPEEELARLEDSYAKRQREFAEEMERLGPEPRLERLILMLKKAVFLRDYRDMIRQKLNLCLREFYQVIGDRMGLTVEDVALLTNQEILQHLKRAERFNKHEIKKRQHTLLLYQCGEKVEIYSGEEARKRVELLQLYGQVKAGRLLKGLVGSPGKAQGRARIVYTNKDLGKVEPGDILVTTMTRQDFVPAMRKAKAIVTDEGSVTCHAAIIARELGIPCVVGVQNATTVIKDGVQIKLDGKGKVEILD